MALSDPFEGCFSGAHVTKEVTVVSDEAPSHERVQLSALDTAAFILSLFESFIFVFKEELDFDRLHAAAKELLKRIPLFSGRVCTDNQHLEIELNNKGFPLTAVDWPEGGLDDFPAAHCGKEWLGDLPSKIKSPIILHPSDPEDALFHDAPIFALRLTTLGKGGGCLLTCTYYHILGDGAKLMSSLVDLSRAYRGESLQPLGRWLHRDLLLPENIHQLLPGGKQLVEEALEAVKDVPPLPEGTTCRDILKATVAKPGRDIASWVWARAPEMPEGPRQNRMTMLHLPKAEVANLKQDVIAHATAQGIEMPKILSANDIIVAINFCMKAIYVNAPLPGQGGSSRPELGFAVLDVAFNALKGPAMEGFYGNGLGRATTFCPPSPVHENGAPDEGSDGSHKDARNYSREALLTGIAYMAASMRASVTDWRDPHGAGIKQLLTNICSPRRAYEDCARIEGASKAVTLRATITSWERFPFKEVVFDEAEGPALHFLPYTKVVSDVSCVLYPCMDGSCSVLYITVPADRAAAALDVLHAVLPSATYM